MLRKFFIAACLVLFSATVFGDMLTLKDGRSFKGKLINKNDKVVVFRVYKGKIKSTFEFPIAKVLDITEEKLSDEIKNTADKTAKPVISGPTYMVIPMEGIIGLDISKKVFEKCLMMARSAKPAVVFLDIDSTGGRSQDVIEMIELLNDYSELRFAGFVRKAQAEAALFALCLKDIIMFEKGCINGGRPYESRFNSKNNIISNLSFYSSQLISAGHDQNWPSVLFDASSNWHMRDKKLYPTRGWNDSAIEFSFTKLNGFGTVSADQAVKAGLAKAKFNSPEKSNAVFGLTEWSCVSNSPIGLIKGWQKKVKRIKREHKRLLDHVDQKISEAHRIASTINKKTTKDQYVKKADVCQKLFKDADIKLKRIKKINSRYPSLSEYHIISSCTEEFKSFDEKRESVYQTLETFKPEKLDKSRSKRVRMRRRTR